MRPSLRLNRHRATTAQLAVLFPAVAPPSDAPGPAALGHAVIGGGAHRFDPFDAYAAGQAANPNLCIFGEPGSGKSASVKTMVHRWVGLDRPDGSRRWVGICDPKGEYAPLAEALDLDVLALRPGGTVRLNPLAVYGNEDDDEAGARRVVLVAALGASLLGRELRPVEDAVLGWAVDALGRDRRATLADVTALLAAPTEEMAARSGNSTASLAASVEDLRFAFGKLLDRQLRGMFDGDSTVDPDRSTRGVVVDLSAVHADRDALGVVMVAATAWLRGVLARRDGTQRLQVIDEAWALLANPAAVRHLQASWKLCRDYGVANIAIAHRISDLRAQADDGTALAKVAAGLLADTETRVLFRQPPDQVAEAKALLDLSPVQADLLPRLARGRAVWKRPTGDALVQHVVAESEWFFCDSDGALLGRSHSPRLYAAEPGISRRLSPRRAS